MAASNVTLARPRENPTPFAVAGGALAGAKTLLGIWAHPDDETVVAGGLLADAARHGLAVHCLHLTRGEAGRCAHGPVAPPELGAIREQELAAALARLGVRHKRMLGHPDGRLATVPDGRALADVLTELAAVDPDVVVSFGPDGFTGHPDHRRLSRWVRAALRAWDRDDVTVLEAVVPPAWSAELAPALAEFDVFWPGYPAASGAGPGEAELGVVLDDDLLAAKTAALEAHGSQLRPWFDRHGRGFVEALGACELYRVAAASWSRQRPPRQP